MHRDENSLLSVDAILRGFDRAVARRLVGHSGLKAVYAYEDSACDTFRAAKSLNLTCIYELPIGHWRVARDIYLDECALQPEWAGTLTGLRDSPAKLARKELELQLADVVVVPSAFVCSTLLEHFQSQASVVVTPYGAPPIFAGSLPNLSPSPLKVLFVGSLGQRKGLSYLLDAIDLVSVDVRLTLIGQPSTSECRPLRIALDRHNWIPTLSHQLILEQMRMHHVLVFPTLFDGFGLVITEALSQGLPVICTSHSGAPECISHGVEGFIVPIRNSRAIAECLEDLASDPDRLSQMRKACLRRASELQWDTYERLLVQTISQFLH